jgi:hypothetical protein
MEEPGPRFQAGPPENPLELGSEVADARARGTPGRVPLPGGDDEFLPLLGRLPRLFKEGP